MIKFEVGKKYKYIGGEALEVRKRNDTTIWFVVYQHSGKPNERIQKEGRAPIKDWGEKEVIFVSNKWQVNANKIY